MSKEPQTSVSDQVGERMASCTRASNRSQSVPKLVICFLSQFKKDTSEPSVSAQEVYPMTYLLQIDVPTRI